MRSKLNLNSEYAIHKTNSIIITNERYTNVNISNLIHLAWRTSIIPIVLGTLQWRICTSAASTNATNMIWDAQLKLLILKSPPPFFFLFLFVEHILYYNLPACCQVLDLRPDPVSANLATTATPPSRPRSVTVTVSFSSSLRYGGGSGTPVIPSRASVAVLLSSAAFRNMGLRSEYSRYGTHTGQ